MACEDLRCSVFATGEFEFGVVPTPLQPIVVTTTAAGPKRIAPIVTRMIPSVDVEVIFNRADVSLRAVRWNLFTDYYRFLLPPNIDS